MAGKQAKILSALAVEQLLGYAAATRNPARNKVVVLLSAKAGLRAGEIAKLTWPMVFDANAHVGETIELHDKAAKKGSGRSIPIHPKLKNALARLAAATSPEGFVIR